MHMENNNSENHEKLKRSKAELEMLYEISLAMRTTLELEQILYIILTAVTSHEGLGFNRAMLFLVNEKEHRLEGALGIGPDTGEEADKIWRHITERKLTMEDLINEYHTWKKRSDTKLNATVKKIRIPLKEDAGILALTALEGMSFEVQDEEARLKADGEITSLLGAEYFVTVPLMAKDKVLGALMVDNIYTKKLIEKDDMWILAMFANQAGLAIENSMLYEKAKNMAQFDYQTQVYNHGHFQHLLGNELKSRAENKGFVSLLMLDLDNFKHYNDTLGHQAGDLILQRLSEMMKANVRPQDYVCRYGGEEFAIIMPDASKEAALNQAEKLRKAIEKAKALTVSIGIASFPVDASSKDGLIKHSDQALYKAKHAGKNKTCLYGT